MTDSDRVAKFLTEKLQDAGRQYEQARRAFSEARLAARADLPTEDGNVRIVCRRHAEKRAVELDSEAQPACFEGGHPDCEGCVEDIEDGCIETW